MKPHFPDTTRVRKYHRFGPELGLSGSAWQLAGGIWGSMMPVKKQNWQKVALGITRNNMVLPWSFWWFLELSMSLAFFPEVMQCHT